SQRHGSARAVWRALSEMRRQGATDPLRRQGNQLLRQMPDGWQGSCGPQPVATAGFRLAPHHGRVGSTETALRIRPLFAGREKNSGGWCFVVGGSEDEVVCLR